MKLQQQFRSARALRLVGLVACGALLFLCGFAICPPAPTTQTYADDPAPAEDPSITIGTAGTIAANLAPTSSSGSFASASGTFSVTTTNETGYTLKIKSTVANGTDLKYTDTSNNNAVYTIPTLNANTTISESDFSTSSTYNNKWGYKPSKLDSAVNNNYIPAPSTDGDTIDVTEEANVEANDYTISLGARANYETKAGNYTNTFVIEAVPNALPEGIMVKFSSGEQSIFPDGRTTNTLFYSRSIETESKIDSRYMTSCNIAIDGSANPVVKGDYSKCAASSRDETISILNADFLEITAVFDLAVEESESDVVALFEGESDNANNRIFFCTGTCGSSLESPLIKRVEGDTVRVKYLPFVNQEESRMGKGGYGILIDGYARVSPIIYGEYAIPESFDGGLFAGWDIDGDGGVDYSSWEEVEESLKGGLGSDGSSIMLDAVYKDCAEGKICYSSNGAPQMIRLKNGMADLMSDTMWQDDGNSGYVATLSASNYSRDGYGFVGWNTSADGSGVNYGPNEVVECDNNDGLVLYANWVPVAIDSSGNELTFQTTDLLNVSLDDNETLADKETGYFTALKDLRDNQVYAVAKLADGNYWMIENLRLDNNVDEPNWGDNSLSQGFGGVFGGLANSESTGYGGLNSNSLYSIDGSGDTKSITGDYQDMRFPRYNSSKTADYTTEDTEVHGPYSYGNYYTWAAAIGNTNDYGRGSSSTTSICPKGWHLPYGGNTTGTRGGKTSGGFYYLGMQLEATENNELSSQKWRAFPNNFILSGDYQNRVFDDGSKGLYWSSRSNGALEASLLILEKTAIDVGSKDANDAKSVGVSVRCVKGS